MNNVIPLMPNTLSLDQHIKLISETWKETNSDYIGGIIKTGQELIAAREQHGEALRTMADKLPFHWKTANKLIAIFESFGAHGRRAELPPSWTTLYELTKLPEKLMLQALDDGRIHPNMKRSEAVALKPKTRKLKKTAEKAKSKTKPLTLTELKSHIVASFAQMNEGKRFDAMHDLAKYLEKQFPGLNIRVSGTISTLKIGG